MNDQSTGRVAPDKLAAANLNLNLDELLDNDKLERMIGEGKLTRAEADELLEAAGRRVAATEGRAPDPENDDDGTVTEGGFGSGQGMASQSTRHGHVAPPKPS